MIIIVLLCVFILFTWLSLRDPNEDGERQVVGGDVIPMGTTHWHPKLTIKIDGEIIPIPPDIGSGTGRIIDTHLSGMNMSPTHTHEDDGTIHLENLDPSQKPETLTLGYFFYVWDKPFSSMCIFEYCTTEGILRMYVNGQRNEEYGQYIMRDGDDIVIEYISTKEDTNEDDGINS
ncbi:hypothetical protein HY496_03220 [Candidatus Woesearchaeota archaeon]|nr:hypothetical protein [Candidatus Woesearchaeota archaeon]